MLLLVQGARIPNCQYEAKNEPQLDCCSLYPSANGCGKSYLPHFGFRSLAQQGGLTQTKPGEEPNCGILPDRLLDKCCNLYPSANGCPDVALTQVQANSRRVGCSMSCWYCVFSQNSVFLDWNLMWKNCSHLCYADCPYIFHCCFP